MNARQSVLLGQALAAVWLAASSTLASPSIAATTAGTNTILFTQPEVTSIESNIFVANVTKAGVPTGTFDLVSWNKSPKTPSGTLVPTTWNAGSMTGFTPTSTSGTQLGFQNESGTSTAQMEATTVGAYINSKDLPSSALGQKMMVSPEYLFASGDAPVPFENSSSSLTSSMDLQVPVAVGNDTYVSADFLFEDPTGVRVSVNVGLFSNGHYNVVVGSGYDAPSRSYSIEPPIAANSKFVTPESGSATWASTPWLGWRHFEWSISQPQFVAVLRYLETEFPGKIQTTDPAKWALAEVHLNAEFHLEAGGAELGWSMRDWSIWSNSPTS